MMSEENVIVGLGELRVSQDPAVILVAYGLGSCVGVSAYDPVIRVGGLLHCLLPESNGSRNDKPAKFVDTGIPFLLKELEQMGAVRRRIVLKMAGGARMLKLSGPNHLFDIGARNVAKAMEILKREGLRLAAADTGGTTGRTVRMSIDTGRVMIMIKTLNLEKEL